MDLTVEKRQKLEEIAKKFNTSIEKLISENEDIEELIKNYESGNFRVLNE